MSVNVNDKSGLVESFTPGYEGCGCGNRRYYTKAEIDEMFRNVLDPEQIEKIVKEVVDEYVTSEEFSQVIISIIGEDYYTKAQIDTILEGYATKAWTTGDTDSRISTAMASETARTEDVYAKKTDVPSLDGYATTGWVDSQNYLKDITLTINGTELHNNGSIIIEGGGGEPIDLSDYAKTTAVTEAIETAIASETARTESTYAKKTDIPSLEGYATENYVDAAITAATENLPSKNWVIGHTDLAMATETGRTESTYAKKTDLDGKVDTSAFTAYTATTKECCDYVKGEIDDLWAIIATLTGDTPTPPTPEPNPYASEYLTVEALQNGTFRINNTGVEYSVNNGQWVTNHTERKDISLISGDKVRFRGHGGTDESGSNPLAAQLFLSNGMPFKVYGNLLSLEYYDSFSGETAMTTSGMFVSMFDSACGLTDASNLVLPTGLINVAFENMFKGCTSLTAAPELPATTLASNCYNGMFSYCTSLEVAPVLPAENGAQGCYSYMFTGCSSLKYVKCLLTGTQTAGTYTNLWLNGASQSGVFVKNPNATWSTNTSGIPSGWTVVDNN